jgi:seryl-tRNA synthetase
MVAVLKRAEVEDGIAEQNRYAADLTLNIKNAEKDLVKFTKELEGMQKSRNELKALKDEQRKVKTRKTKLETKVSSLKADIVAATKLLNIVKGEREALMKKMPKLVEKAVADRRAELDAEWKKIQLAQKNINREAEILEVSRKKLNLYQKKLEEIHGKPFKDVNV